MKIVAASRLMYGWAVLLAVVAAMSLVSCATISDLKPKPVSVEPATQAPASTPSATPIPAQPNKSAVVTIGIIGKVDGNTISLQTLEGIIPVHLTVDSVIQEFADSSPGDLTIGQRVTVMGREGESGIAARAVIVTLDNTSLFQDAGDFPIGRAGRALVGTIEKIGADSITVNTKLGPRTATIVAGETAFKKPATVAAAQLSAGQIVTITGSASPAGGITAQSVLITPELGELMSAGRQGGRGGRGGGGGRRGQDPTTSSETPVASPIFDTERKIGIYDGITFVVTEKSMATFRVRKQLALIPLPHRAEMRTTALSGEIYLDGRPSAVAIDLHQLSSGQRLRDGYVRRAMLPDHPKATFTLEDVASLPPGFAEGEESTSRIDGVLNILGADFPLKLNITAQDKGDAITIVGRTLFSWDELGISPPSAGVVLTLGDEVEVRIRLTVKPVR